MAYIVTALYSYGQLRVDRRGRVGVALEEQHAHRSGRVTATPRNRRRAPATTSRRSRRASTAPCSYGPRSYGLRSHGLCSHGLYCYGVYSYGLYL